MNSGFVYRRILLDIIVYVKIIYIIFFKKRRSIRMFFFKDMYFL